MLAGAVPADQRADEGRSDRNKHQQDRKIADNDFEKLPESFPVLSHRFDEQAHRNDEKWQADGGFFRQQSQSETEEGQRQLGFAFTPKYSRYDKREARQKKVASTSARPAIHETASV